MTTNRRRTRGFTLVMTMFFGVLVVVVGASLALTGRVESIVAVRLAAEFDHELALANFITCFPRLWKDVRTHENLLGAPVELKLEAENFAVRGAAVSLRGKLNPTTSKDSLSLAAALRELAQRNGLPMESVRVSPAGTEGNAMDFHWFSQIISPMRYEEVFAWSKPDEQHQTLPHTVTWSQLVSFWKDEGAELFALELETSIQGSTPRCWYVIISLKNGRARTLYQGSCS